ncbi:hypothetical protein CANCADRAFT_30311 [Tortispora caseinolytica NRRL Y-17796]|uniref:Amine oxidase domain-containing protein n=1 Tax=Tortispora caseinolytica NRRL Y-17796 TaxID=767744 RepID=A0A1E4TJW7_9ASCO|nr:hypothetical protein CANCADRAFT_30311 [Tortispora caseinolytica NRRL Y-17796]
MIRVAVIGGGVAGITAAKELASKKFQVTLFEAKSTLGGKTCTFQSAIPLDLGPNWIHGDDPKHNPIVNLISSEVQFHDFNSDKETLFDRNGETIDDPHLKGVMWEVLDAAIKYSYKNTATIDSSLSLMDFAKTKYTDQVILDCVTTFGNYPGIDVHDQSLKYLFLEDCCPGKTLFVKGAYNKLINVLTASLPQSVKIITNTKVESITSNETSALISFNNVSEHFDAVVCALPLGSLKSNLIHISPALPKHITQFFSQIGIGNLEKLYITFSSKFWQSELYQFPDSFASSLSAVDVIAISDDPPILLVYYSGNLAKKLQHDLGPIRTPDWDPNLAENDWHIVLRYFHKHFEAIGYLPNSHKIESIVATRWLCDPLAGYGAYPNFPTTLKDIGPLEDLKKGLPGQRLWFAGDYTGSLIAMSTVTGAYLGGQNAAARIRDYFLPIDIANS